MSSFFLVESTKTPGSSVTGTVPVPDQGSLGLGDGTSWTESRRVEIMVQVVKYSQGVTTDAL